MLRKWDVLVAGAGPAGLAAAYGAARNGARVLLLEKEGFVGGSTTGGLSCGWRGDASSAFIERMRRICIRAWGRLIFDPEEAAELYLGLIDEYAIDLITGAAVCGAPVSDRGEIDCVEAMTRRGVARFAAVCYVDATGQGDLAALAGAPFQEEEGDAVSAALTVQLGGIDTRDPLCFSQERMSELAARWPEKPAGWTVTVAPAMRGGTGFVTLDLSLPIKDGSDGFARAERACRTAVRPLIDLLREEMPGYADCHLIRTASGVRMPGRRIAGRYEVTGEDIRQGRTFDDWIVTRACSYPSGEEAPCLPFTLPYRCLLPRGIRNLLLAGGTLSCTPQAAPYCRTLPVSMAAGQAAGTAAALAAGMGGRARRVDVPALQDRLLEQGVAPPRPQFMLHDAVPAAFPDESGDEDGEDAVPFVPEDAGRRLDPGFFGGAPAADESGAAGLSEEAPAPTEQTEISGTPENAPPAEEPEQAAEPEEAPDGEEPREAEEPARAAEPEEEADGEEPKEAEEPARAAETEEEADAEAPKEAEEPARAAEPEEAPDGEAPKEAEEPEEGNRDGWGQPVIRSHYDMLLELLGDDGKPPKSDGDSAPARAGRMFRPYPDSGSPSDGKARQPCVTLRRDGKSAMDIDVQDLL